MFQRHCSQQLLLLLLAIIPKLIICGPVSSPEISTKTGKSNNNNLSLQLQQQQQQHQQQHQQQQQQQQKSLSQDAHLNSLNVYATNYDVIANNQNSANSNDEQFKPSYKLPEMETNFTPIQNGNSIAPEFATNYGAPAPVLMQYLPQTINEGGVQYLQLIPTRPLMVPIGPYLTGNAGVQALPYHQHLTPSNNIDYSARPMLSALPVNMPPPAPAALVDVPSSPLPAYGIQSYSANLAPYKQNYRINRETKDKQLLGPISLNMNEYIPGSGGQQQHMTYNIRGRL